MLKRDTKLAGLALMMGGLFAVSGCRKDTDDVAEGTAHDTGRTSAADTGMAPAPGAALSDANIVYILDNANMLDSSAGAVAATKGTASEVRDFGKMMVRDHHSLRKQGQDLAKKLGVTPEAPVNDGSKASYDKTIAMLSGAAKGKDFDRAYMDNEVAYHLDVLQIATTAMSAAQNAELKNLIQKAAPTIQAHLDRAEAIQSKLK